MNKYILSAVLFCSMTVLVEASTPNSLPSHVIHVHEHDEEPTYTGISNNLTRQQRLMVVSGVFTVFWVMFTRFTDEHEFYEKARSEGSELYTLYIKFAQFDEDLSHLSQQQVDYLFSRIVNDFYVYIINNPKLAYRQDYQEPLINSKERMHILQALDIIFSITYPEYADEQKSEFLAKIEYFLKNSATSELENRIADFFWLFNDYCENLEIDMPLVG